MENSKIKELKLAVKKSRLSSKGRSKFDGKIKAMGVELASTGMSATEITHAIDVSYATALRWVRASTKSESSVEIIRQPAGSQGQRFVVNLRLPSGVVIEDIELDKVPQVLDAVS